MEKYDKFIKENPSLVSTLESTLRSVSYILPGRFEHADIASEFLYSCVNLLGIYHDAVLAQEAQAQNPTLPISRFNRFVRYLLKSSSIYKNASILLTAIQSLEVLLEMTALKWKGSRTRSKLVLFIEIVKAACRLALIQSSGNRLLLKSAVPERDYDMSRLKPASEASESTLIGSWSGARTGKLHVQVDSLISRKPKSEKTMQYLLSRALSEPAPTPLSLVSPLDRIRKLGEVLFVLRPLLYVLLLRRFGSRSFIPWLASLLVELFSFSTSFDLSTMQYKLTLTNLERNEVKRRAFLLLYYLLRNPFYAKFSRGFMNSFIKSARTKPLLSLLATLLSDYQPLWEKYYFYTSGM